MARLVLLPVVIALTTGCAVEKFAIRDRSCSEKFTRWSGDLTEHLLRGKRTQGRWDYDPRGEAQARNFGSYDLGSGDFGWTVMFHADHWRERVDADGYGFAYPNGDLDVEYTMVTEDVLGEEWSVDVREQRYGCDAVRRVRTDDDEHFTEGEYRNGVYRSETWWSSDPTFVLTGTERDDGTWTRRYSDDGYTTIEDGDADGYARREFSVDAAEVPYDGSVERFLDGSQHWVLDFDDGTAWDYTYDYSGDGSGTYQSSELSCKLTYESFECTAECDGETYTCS